MPRSTQREFDLKEAEQIEKDKAMFFIYERSTGDLNYYTEQIGLGDRQEFVHRGVVAEADILCARPLTEKENARLAPADHPFGIGLETIESPVKLFAKTLVEREIWTREFNYRYCSQ